MIFNKLLIMFKKTKRKNDKNLCHTIVKCYLPYVLVYKSMSCIKARFHYERGKKHSLFVLLLFFALASIED